MRQRLFLVDFVVAREIVPWRLWERDVLTLSHLASAPINLRALVSPGPGALTSAWEGLGPGPMTTLHRITRTFQFLTSDIK